VGALTDIGGLISGGKKIQAIKRLRTETGSGLKEAKHAIDRMQDPTLTHYPGITTIPCIKSITVDMGSGEVKMTLEHFNMITLMNMQSVGIEDTRRLLDLYDIFRAWENSDPLKDSGEDSEEA
jgi:hypothetical protein